MRQRSIFLFVSSFENFHYNDSFIEIFTILKHTNYRFSYKRAQRNCNEKVLKTNLWEQEITLQISCAFTVFTRFGFRWHLPVHKIGPISWTKMNCSTRRVSYWRKICWIVKSNNDTKDFILDNSSTTCFESFLCCCEHNEILAIQLTVLVMEWFYIAIGF